MYTRPRNNENGSLKMQIADSGTAKLSGSEVDKQSTSDGRMNVGADVLRNPEERSVTKDVSKDRPDLSCLS